MDSLTEKRGTKRKRYEPPEQDLAIKIGGKLHHGVKEVKKAAKKAKTFETQKLVKKLKELRKTSTSEKLKEVEEELQLVKDFDHELVATTALKTKINKTRLLSENEHVRASIDKELSTSSIPSSSSSAAGKVQSRLLSSKLLAAEVVAVVEGLKNLLQPSQDESRSHKHTKTDLIAAAAVERSVLPVGDVVVDENLPESGANVDGTGWESGTVDDDEDADEESWESGSINDGGQHIGVLSADESDDDELVIPSTPAAPQVSAKAPGIQSTFLPSLSVGFTRGESDDSDLSETEIKAADIDIKKNRRGQRARRAIWEKKFGKNANHKKKELEMAGPGRPTSTPGHYSDRRAFGAKQRSTDNRTVSVQRQTGNVTSGAQLQRKGGSITKGRVEDKPVHPSWAAKRKLKEKGDAIIVPSQGKKIKF